MKAKDALQILREKGTLRTRKAPRNVIREKQVNQAVALAASTLVTCCSSRARGRSWMPPSDVLAPLP